MKRQVILLFALAAVALLAIFYLFAWQPQREELAAVETEIAAEEATQAQLQSEIAELRSVREETPAVIADLATAESIIPFDAALPAALRQLQSAADESQLDLIAVAPARPVQIEGAAPGVALIATNVQLQGSYFQIVDFLRRTEGPSISPRAMLWQSISLSKDEYPTLTVAVTGSLFAQLPAAPAPAEVPPAGDAEADDAVADDADVEVDVEVNTTEDGQDETEGTP